MCRTLSSIENVYYNLQQFNVGFMGGAADCSSSSTKCCAIQSHFQYELPKSNILNCAGFFFMHGNQFLMGSERFMLSILDFSF